MNIELKSPDNEHNYSLPLGEKLKINFNKTPTRSKWCAAKITNYILLVEDTLIYKSYNIYLPTIYNVPL